MKTGNVELVNAIWKLASVSGDEAMPLDSWQELYDWTIAARCNQFGFDALQETDELIHILQWMAHRGEIEIEFGFGFEAADFLFPAA